MSDTKKFLDKFIDTLQTLTSEQWPLHCVRNRAVVLGEERFKFNVWIDEVDRRKLLVFELRKKEVLF